MAKQWWQVWKKDSRQGGGGRSQGRCDGSIFVHGYAVTPGSKLHRGALELLGLESDEGLEEDMNVDFPEAEILDVLAKQWVEAREANTDELQRQRQVEIGRKLNELGGTELMRSVAYKLIYANLAYESDFYAWHGIGDWRN